MKRPAALLWMAAAWSMTATLPAATAYVSDELVLSVYSEENGQGQRLATLHSGAILEAVRNSGEFTEVRLPNGIKGWVRSTYLTAEEPAVIRIKHLEEELNRSRATTPALAEAAARNEVLQLKGELDEARRSAALKASPSTSAGGAAKSAWTIAVLVSLTGGFWLGYATLARRIRARFGGLRVY